MVRNSGKLGIKLVMFFSKSVLRNVISLKLASDRRVVIQASDSEAEVFLTHSFPGELLVDLSFQGWNLCFLAANAALPQSPFCSQWPHGSKNTQDRAGSVEVLELPC